MGKAFQDLLRDMGIYVSEPAAAAICCGVLILILLLVLLVLRTARNSKKIKELEKDKISNGADKSDSTGTE